MAYEILGSASYALYKLNVGAIAEQWINCRSTRNEQDVELRALVECFVRDKFEPALAGHYVLGDGKESYLSVRQSCEKLMWAGYVELREAREENDANREFHVGRQPCPPYTQGLLHRTGSKRRVCPHLVRFSTLSCDPSLPWRAPGRRSSPPMHLGSATAFAPRFQRSSFLVCCRISRRRLTYRRDYGLIILRPTRRVLQPSSEHHSATPWCRGHLHRHSTVSPLGSHLWQCFRYY